MAHLRGSVFLLIFYALMLVMGVVGSPVVLWRQDWTRAWMKLHNRIAFALLRALCGTRIEVRGTVPTGRVIVAAKHQSMLDVLVLFNLLPEARFAMKRELLLTPVFGLYARRAGAVPIDRSAGAEALERLRATFAEVGGQVVVYPQGTRVRPWDRQPYRRGAATLYASLERPLVPAATNAGHFWPRRGLARHPGTAVVEFLDPIAPGLGVAEARARIEAVVEGASDALGHEAEAALGARDRS